MTRPIKPEHILSSEDKKGITEGVTTIAQVSKDKNIPYGSIYNQVKKGKLAVQFKKSEGGNTTEKLPPFSEQESVKPIDYTSSVSNFWSFIDMIFRFICPLFKLEYIGMDKVTIDDLTEKTKEKLGSLITGHQYVDWLGTIGVIGYTFVTRIHIKKKESKNQEQKSVESSKVGSQAHRVESENKTLEVTMPLEQPKENTQSPINQEYELTESGHVKSKMSVEDIKKKLGL